MHGHGRWGPAQPLGASATTNQYTFNRISRKENHKMMGKNWLSSRQLNYYRVPYCFSLKKKKKKKTILLLSRGFPFSSLLPCSVQKSCSSIVTLQ